MKIKVVWVGNTKSHHIEELIEIFKKRLSHYCRLEIIECRVSSKSRSANILISEEAKVILAQIESSDYVVALDESGKQNTSIQFSTFLQNRLNQSSSNLVFIIGGAFGMAPEIIHRSNNILSLSRMTFTHDMVRIFLLEQLYRAFTIIKGEKYHNA